MITSLLATTEILAFLLGLYVFFRSRGGRAARSFSFAAVTMMAVYSLTIQTFFLLRLPHWYFLADIVIVAFSAMQTARFKSVLKKEFCALWRFLGENRVVGFVVAPLFIYLFLQAFLSPPGNSDSMVYNLARVLMFQQEGGVFPANYSTFHQVAFPVGFDILSFLFLRFFSDYGLGLFSFISYLAIVSGTWALAAGDFSKKIALATVLVIASLGELALQASSTKNDIPAAALATVIFLAGRDFLEKSGATDFFMMILALVWGLTVKGYFSGFAAPFVLFYLLLLLKKTTQGAWRKRWRPIAGVFKKPSLTTLSCAGLIIGLIVCAAFFHGGNFRRFGNIWGDPRLAAEHRNKDGILGGVCNAARYIVQSAEIPITYGYKLNEWHQNLPDGLSRRGVRPGTGKTDLAAKQFLSEDYAWYGPFGIWLIMPSLVYCLFMAQGFIRVVALSLIAFFWMVSWQIAWMPWNGRFFSLFYAGSGLCVAFVLNRFFKNKRKWVISGVIVLMSLYGLAGAVWQNDLKKTIPAWNSASLGYNLWRSGETALKGENTRSEEWFKWIKQLFRRNDAYTRFWPRPMLDAFINSVEKNKRVLLAGAFSPVFPLLFLRPDVFIEVVRPGAVFWEGRYWDIRIKSNYMAIRENFDYLAIDAMNIPSFAAAGLLDLEEPIWSSEKGGLYRVKKTTSITERGSDLRRPASRTLFGFW